MGNIFDNFKGIFPQDREKEINSLLLDTYKGGIESDLECAVTMLESALAKTNLILNRKNIRTVLSQDEEINIGLLRVRIEKLTDVIRKLDPNEPI